MIISEEQARLAAECLRSQRGATGVIAHPDLSGDLMERVFETLSHEPDLREDRVADARARLAGATPTSGDVASKMISRIISDALR